MDTIYIKPEEALIARSAPGYARLVQILEFAHSVLMGTCKTRIRIALSVIQSVRDARGTLIDQHSATSASQGYFQTGWDASCAQQVNISTM